MLVVVSPAKRLDEQPLETPNATVPVFLDEAQALAEVAKSLTGPNLEKLMHISAKLGALNADRFTHFGTNLGEKPAVHMFSGDTYAGLEAASLEPEEMEYAQGHLRILSGLYGILRPLDIIQPYRLEMGARFKTPGCKNLYEFWGTKIAACLNTVAETAGTETLVNCASVEYFKAVDKTALTPQIITPVFMENQEKGPKIVSFFAKKARGAMARFIIQNRVNDIQGLKDFDTGGYKYQAALSELDKLVFLR